MPTTEKRRVWFICYETNDPDGIRRGRVSVGYFDREDADAEMLAILRRPEVHQALMNSAWIEEEETTDGNDHRA